MPLFRYVPYCRICYGMEQKRAGCFTILVGAVLLGAVLDRCSGKHPSESAPVVSTPAVPAQTPAEQAAQIEHEAARALANPRYAIGQEFSVGYFSYRVNRVEVKSDAVSSPILAIDVTIRNDDSSDTMTPMLSLLDEHGKKRGGTILELGLSGDLITELRPGVAYRGYAAFENVPTDGKYILLVSGGMTSGRSAIVPLFEQTAEPPSASEPPGISQGQANTTPSPPSDPQPSITTIPSAPSANASSQISGVLCSGPIEVPQNGELTFKNLPGDQLHFIFDHSAWQLTIRRQPDGTQTVIMRSIKPGIQTKCDMRWEKIVQ